MAEFLNTAFYGLDRAVFIFFNNLSKSIGGFLSPIFNFITFFGNGGWAFIVFGVICLLFKNSRKLGLTVLLSLLVGSIITNIALKNLVARPRPYDSNQEYFIYWQQVGGKVQSEFSFPSGHTTVTTAWAMALFLTANKKWSYIGFILALIMGATRIYFIVHYFTDILGGLIAGSLAGILGYYITKLIYSKIEKHKNNKFSNFVLESDLRSLFKK